MEIKFRTVVNYLLAVFIFLNCGLVIIWAITKTKPGGDFNDYRTHTYFNLSFVYKNIYELENELIKPYDPDHTAAAFYGYYIKQEKERYQFKPYLGLGILVTAICIGQKWVNSSKKQYWRYKHNGTRPTLGVSSMRVHPHDTFSWCYR